MCRSKELGGRRCPQHTDPVKHAAYNKHRREMYALKKNPPEPTSAFTVDPEVYGKFLPLDEIRPSSRNDKAVVSQHNKESVRFSKKIDPTFTVKDWDAVKTNYDREWDPEGNDREIVIDYTDWGYRNINEHLNGMDLSSSQPSTLNEEQKARAELQIKAIDRALTKAGLSEEPRLLYRGMRIPSQEKNNNKWLKDNFPVGGVVSQKSYMSTTLDAGLAVTHFTLNSTYSPEDTKDVIFEIVSRKGAVLGKGTSKFSSRELEVLIPRETKFRVLSRDNHVKYLFTDSKQDSLSSTQTVIRLIDANEDNNV